MDGRIQQRFWGQSYYYRNRESALMLNEESAKALGLKGKFTHGINTPSFTNIHQLWHKSQNLPQPFEPNKTHHLNFFKFGKTFGFETTRYLEFKEGILYYYQGNKDSVYKGYCYLENVYMFYLELEESNLLHLTNGAEYSQFYFKDHSFVQSIPRSFFRNVIQINFKENYSMLEMIGKGSFSKVFLAKMKKNDQKVAVKIVSKKDKHGVSTKGITEEEKRILTIMNSDYVCKMLEFYEEDDVYIFVLEYLEGVDLFKLYKDKTQFSMEALLHIFKCILSGLMHCHQKKVIHRDIKPQNIIVDQNTYTAKLIDFGLSLIVNPNTSKKSYKRCGTMGYMAHEVIKNSAQFRKPYTDKVDIFSFGIIAHMMLLQKNPLKGHNYEETFAKNNQCKIQLNKELIITRYGHPCLEFLDGLLQIDPTKRWSAVQALNCQFMKEKPQKVEKIIKTETDEEFPPEKIMGSYIDQEEGEVGIQMQKVESIVPKKVNF